MSDLELKKKKLKLLKLKRERAAMAESQPAPESGAIQSTDDVGTIDVARSYGAGIAKGTKDMVDLGASLTNPSAHVDRAVAAIRGFKEGEGFWDTAGKIVGGVIKAGESPIEKKVSDETLGRLAERPVEKGLSKAADAAYTAGEWTAPIPGGPGAKAITKFDALMGATAATGELVGGDTGEMVGGMLPAAVAVLKPQRSAAASAAKATARDEKAVLKFFEDNAHNPEQAIANLKAARASGEVGDLADLTKDQGIANVVSGLPGGTKGAVQRARVQEARDLQTLEKAGKVFGEVEPGAAEKMAGEKLARTQAKIRSQTAGKIADAEAATADAIHSAEKQQRSVLRRARGMLEGSTDRQMAESASRETRAMDELEQAVTQRQAAERQLVPDASVPSQSSENVVEAFTRHNDQMKKEMTQPLWDIFNKSPDLDMQKIKGEMRLGLSGKEQNQFADKTIEEAIDRYPALKALDDAKDKVVDGRWVHDKISQAKADLSEGAYKSTDKAIVTRIVKNLEESIGRQDPTNAFKAASDAERKRHILMGDKLVERVLAKSKPSEAGDKLFASGPKGSEMAQAVLQTKNESIYNALEQHIKTVMQKAVANGNVDTLLERHQDFLAQWSTARKGFVDDLFSLADAQRAEKAVGQRTEGFAKTESALRQSVEKKAGTKTLDLGNQSRARVDKERSTLNKALEKHAKAAEKRGESLKKAVEKSVLADFKRSPETTLQNLLTGKDQGKRLKALSNSFKTPAEKAAFKAEVGRRFMANITESVAGAQRISPKSLDKLEGMKQRLSEVLSPSEMDELNEALSNTLTQQMKQTARKQTYELGESEVKKLAGSFAAVAVINGTTPTHALMMGGVLRRAFSKALSLGEKEARVRLLDEFASNPQQYLDAMERSNVFTKDPDQTRKNIEQWFEKAARPAARVSSQASAED